MSTGLSFVAGSPEGRFMILLYVGVCELQMWAGWNGCWYSSRGVLHICMYVGRHV